MSIPSDESESKRLWAVLCDGLDAELERQETVLSLCLAQGKAARANDLDYLTAKIAALELLAGECAEAEKERVLRVEQLVRAAGLNLVQPNLSALSAAAPAPFQARLRELQPQLREVISATREAIADNRRVVRHCLRKVQNALSGLGPFQEMGSPVYGRRGQECATAMHEAALLDSRG